MIQLSRFAQRDHIPLSSADLSGAFAGLFATAKSGVKVTQQTAMQHSTVYACYNVLSEGVASLPLHVMERKGDSVFKSAHPIDRLIHDRPNQEMTSFTWVYAMMLNAVSRGVAYSQIVRDLSGRIVGIYPLLSDNMEPRRREDGTLVYLYRHSAYGTVPLDPSEVLHVPAYTLDGMTPISPIQSNANALGLSMAMEEFGSNFFKNGANAHGAFSAKEELSDVAYNRLKEDIKRNYTGLKNSGVPLLLEGGMEFQRITIPNNDSQFLESRKYQRSEIAAIFKVPLHMINDLEKSSFNNMEQQSLDFVIHTLRPWVLRFEQALNAALFGEDTKYFVRFNMAALLRGDTKTRYEAYGTGIRDGWLLRNEAREMEDLNPLDGLSEPILPLNMTQGDPK